MPVRAETAPVRPHTVAEALPGPPRGFAITCAVLPGDTPWKPPSPRLSPSTGDDHPLLALMDTRVPSVGRGLSPREGWQTCHLGGRSNAGVTEMGLSRGADGHEEQSGQGGYGDLHGTAGTKGTTSGAGAGVAAGLSSARCSAPAAAALLLSSSHWVHTGFQGKKIHASYWGNYVRITQFC